jgi:hypothetical protein
MKLDQPSVQQENAPVLAKTQPHSLDTRDLYERVLNFWSLHVGARDPDLRQLADIHHALCNLELQLYPQMQDQCLANLKMRLSHADYLHLDLPLPLWASNALADLQTIIEEKA